MLVRSTAREQGVNALVEASDLVLRTLDTDDKAKGLRFNWTIAKAGAVSNIIPASASGPAATAARAPGW